MIHTMSSYSFCSPEKESQACGGIPRDKNAMTTNTAKLPGELLTLSSESGSEKKNRGLSSSRKEPAQPVPGEMLRDWALLLWFLKPAAPNPLPLALPI